jgi:hypothetical protein
MKKKKTKTKKSSSRPSKAKVGRTPLAPGKKKQMFATRIKGQSLTDIRDISTKRRKPQSDYIEFLVEEDRLSLVSQSLLEPREGDAEVLAARKKNGN